MQYCVKQKNINLLTVKNGYSMKGNQLICLKLVFSHVMVPPFAEAQEREYQGNEQEETRER